MLPQLPCVALFQMQRARHKEMCALQGGTSRIPNMAKRLQRDVKRLVDARVGSAAKVEVRILPALLCLRISEAPLGKPAALMRKFHLLTGTRAQVTVLAHKRLQHAVWMGGSLLAKSPSFPACCTSRSEYAETGYVRQRRAALWDSG